MARLVALDFPLGPDLEHAVRDCVDHARAFCILDQRLAPRQRRAQLVSLGATDCWDPEGRSAIDGGQPVDDEVGLVALTSGSSGRPKAAELTWSALASSARLTQESLHRGGEQIWFPVLPANHIGGIAVILRAVLGEAKLHWGDPTDFAAALSQGATHVAIVRAHLTRQDLSGFGVVLLGGARPPALTASNVISTWGMTETGSGVAYNGVALPEVDIASVNGEILVRTPTLFRSYRDAPRPRATGPDGLDDWFPTGDGGVLVDGRLTIHGRLAYVINTGGEKVWPEDLEAAIATLPSVRDVAVIGVEDPEWGQRIVAMVVGDGSNLDHAIRSTANERLGPWAKPKEIRYVAAIPRTASGKIRRSELRHLH